MKKLFFGLFLLFVGPAMSVAFIKAPAAPDHAAATVTQIDGIYIFSFSTPAAPFEKLGSIEKKGLVASGKPDEMLKIMLKKAKQAEIDLILDGEKQKADASKSAGAGAKKAIADYLSEAADIATQTQQIAGGALQGLEDQLFNLVKTGKADFKSLATSIADDITRMGIKQLISGGFGALTGLGGAGGGASTAGLSGLFSSFAGFFDNGGNIPSGQFGVVGEKGPEIVRGPVNVTGREDTKRLSGGNTIIINQPGVSNTREAERSAGATRRAVYGAVNSGSRYA